MEDAQIDALIAQDVFVVDVQVEINTLMAEQDVSRAQLAKMIGLQEAQVDELFQDEPTNLTVQIVARIVHALGRSPQLTTKG